MASGCAVCAATNQCNFAFRNGPGQYCGDWYDYNTLTRKPCCCPLLQVGSPSTCKMTSTQCNCHIYNTNSSPNYNSRPAQTHSKYSYLPNTHQHTVWHPTYRRPSPVAPLIMILLVVGCCFMCCCRKRHWHNHQHDGIPIATAVGVDASCPPENPAFVGYGSTSSSHHYNHHSGGGGNAVASGLGGFAIGTIIGDLIGRNAGSGGHNHYQNNMPIFGGGNDGGYDIVGDSGDNNFGGYDIQGDSGGYDIQGDSGGYDIQGDS